jgi:hypothetical protein
VFDVFCRFGARDFRDIGHKAIFVANSFRTLDVIGWHHAEPVLRSLAYALLDHTGEKENPAKADKSADRPFRQNGEAVKKIREHWFEGKTDAGAATELLAASRTGNPADLSELTVKLLNGGTAPQSLFDAIFTASGELLMQAPGILSLHAMTFTNAAHYAWRRVRNDETRRLLLLQNASFLPLYRGNRTDNGMHLDTLEPLATSAKGEEGVAEIFADIGKDRATASRKILGWLKDNPNPRAFADAARRLVFLKGTNSHDYKFSSAVLEDYEHLSPPWRDRMLASSAFYLRGSAEADNRLVQRTRDAMRG